MFLENADAAINKYESDELIVAAKIPAITNPAINEGSKLDDSTIKMLSESLYVKSVVGNNALPIIPMATAAPKEITTQTVAILLDVFNSLESLIAINLSNT